MPKAKKTTTLTIRIPLDVKAELEKWAAKDSRTSTSYILAALKEQFGRDELIERIRAHGLPPPTLPDSIRAKIEGDIVKIR